jgi:DNA-binding transcriptional ArsR family regulator
VTNRDAYTAIADPTRRRILDLLCERGPLVAGEIAAHFGTASRPGISRHLRVLRECAVVTAERRGKHRNYRVNPEPLNSMRNGWLANFADMQSESLRALRKRAESTP